MTPRWFVRPPHGAGRRGGLLVAGGRLLVLTLLGVSMAVGATGADLRVMTFNLRDGTAADGDHHWPLRSAAVVQAIVQADPDLLGTQECLSFQRDELLAALPGYAVIAQGRDDGSEAGEMFHGFTGTPGPDRIDWVLASPALAIREVVSERHLRGGLWPSDHFPVLGVFTLPPASPRARMLAVNLTVPDAFTVTELDSLLRAEQRLPTAARVAAWAWRQVERGGAEYRFGLADGGYAAAGRLAPGRRHDCISLVYRTTELARARSAVHALDVALATRFAGAAPAEVIAGDGRVDYDHPAHLDYSVDMIRSGHWGTDVTPELAGAAPDRVGSKRYPAGTVTVVPQQRLDPSDLRDGDVVWLVLSADDPGAAALRRDHGLMVGHVGIVVWREGEPWLVHAASRPLPGWYDTPGVVAVPLAAYLRRVERYDALMVTRF